MIKFSLKDKEIDISLTFLELYKLRTKHPNEYKRYFELQKKMIMTDLDAAEVIYIAYLCANQDAIPNVMTFEEFLEKMQNGRQRVWDAYKTLTTDEKN